jgi:hypothetical protein
LTHDTKIVDERFLNSYFCVELILSDTSALILVSSRLPYAANSLRLEMRGDVNSSSLVYSETEQRV